MIFNFLHILNYRTPSHFTLPPVRFQVADNDKADIIEDDTMVQREPNDLPGCNRYGKPPTNDSSLALDSTLR